MDVPNTFCILPFTHLEARADGFVAACCLSQECHSNEKGNPYHLSKDSLSAVWNSQSVKSLRTNLLNGIKDSKCNTCWMEESTGGTSRRTRENRRWTPTLHKLANENFQVNSPLFLDLKLGNTCNLKCRICSPASSSSWMKEWEDIHGHNLLRTMSSSVVSDQDDKRIIMSWPDINQDFWRDMEEWLPHLRYFDIHGGEPFLIRRHFDLLRSSITRGYSKMQSIHYNTNATIFPEDEIKNVWPHFQDVSIMLSIDGTEEHFEYQRHPAKWIDVEKNIFRFMETFPKHNLRVCLTVSSLNAFYLGRYLKYFHSIDMPVWLNNLHAPEYFAISNLSDRAKQAVLQEWDKIGEEQAIVINSLGALKRLLALPSKISFQEQLPVVLTQHDAYRKESYQKTFPEFAKHIL